MLKNANSVPKAWVRWASIVLTVVSEKQEETSRMMFKALAQLEKESTIRDGDYQGFNVGSFQGATKVSIRDIIKQHGEPSARRTERRSVNTKTKEEVEFDVYRFDVIELQCRKGSNDVEWLGAPTIWFIEGIRKKAQRTLERTR